MHKHSITLLDLGGVVFQSTGISNAIIHWDIISTLNHKYGHDLNVGKDVFPDFLRDYNLATQLQLTGDEFLKGVFDTLEINQELIDLIKHKTDIIIVSDNYRENIAYISKRYHFNQWAIKQIYSYDYEMVKGDPRFFQRLVRELQEYKPEEMIFIDDSIEKIKSAEQHGIKGILYKSNEEIKRALEFL